jgi:hypothetical protein
LASPGYTPSELEVISSKVQEDLIITSYGGKSNRLQKGFEEDEKRIQDLGELVRYKNYTSFTAGFFTNSTEIVLPNTLITNGPTDFSDVYWFTVYEGCTSDVLDCTISGNTTVFVEPNIDDTSHGTLPIVLKDPFNKPYVKGNNGRVLRIRSEGRKHTLITDGTFNITKYSVGYIIKPTPIVLTSSLLSEVSQLSDHKQRELLDATVNYCMKIIGDKEALGIDIQTIKE